MFYITKDCVLARTILKSNQYKIVTLNSLITLLPTQPTKNISGFIDGYIIDDKIFEELLKLYPNEKLGTLIHNDVNLYVISNNSYSVPSTKIQVLNSKEQLLKRIDVNKVTPLSDLNSVNRIEPLNIQKQEEKVEEVVTMEKVEEQPQPQPEQEKPKVVVEQPKEQVFKPSVKLEHKVSLTNLNLYDIIDIAYNQNEKFKTIKDQIASLRANLKNLNTNNLDETIDRYLKQEDDACIELVNEFKLIIKNLIKEYEISMDSRVNNLYNQVVEIVSKEMYGLTQESITALMRKRADLLNALVDCLHGILNDYSNVNAVSTDLATLIMPFNFNFEGDADLPLIYDKNTLNNKRLELYKALVEIKLNAQNSELVDKVKVGISLLEEIGNAQDELLNKAMTVSPFILQKNGLDVIYDTGYNTYSVLKIVLLKNKLLSLQKVTIIDRVGTYSKIQEFDNNLEYTTEFPTQQDPSRNYIIVDKSDSLFQSATSIFVPVDFKSTKDARGFVDNIKATSSAKVCMVLTPGSYEMYDKLGTENLIIVPYINEFAEDCKYDEFNSIQNIYKTVLKMR